MTTRCGLQLAATGAALPALACAPETRGAAIGSVHAARTALGDLFA